LTSAKAAPINSSSKWAEKRLQLTTTTVSVNGSTSMVFQLVKEIEFILVGFRALKIIKVRLKIISLLLNKKAMNR